VMIYGIEWYNLLPTMKICRFSLVFSCKILPKLFGEYCLTLFFQLYQPYAAAKAREYLDKPALHETMVKVLQPNTFYY
jgi:hypothetical protein